MKSARPRRSFPHCSDHLCGSAAALYGAPHWLPDAGQPVPGVRRDGAAVETRQNALMNIVTIFLGISVGATATGENNFLPQTLEF